MERVGFAVVGTSAIAEAMVEAMAGVDRAQYVGSVSRSAERAASVTARLGGTTPFLSREAACACSEVDAIYIASPNALHAEQALACIRAGKHVLVEKPLAANEAEAQMVFDEARAHGVVAMEAMRSVHDPGLDVIRRAIERVGQVRRASLRFGKYSSRYDEVLAGRQTNIFDARLATGALMDIGVYCVEAMVALFGAPSAVACAPVLIGHADTQATGGAIDGAGTIIARYDDKVVELSYSKITQDLLACQVEGELGTVTFRGASIPSEGTIRLRAQAAARQQGYSAGASDADRVEELAFEPCANNMCYELEDFVGCICEGDSVEPYRTFTIETLSIMDEARRQAGIVFPADGRAMR